MENNIIYIGIDKLVPHPQNPRKQLGDLTELADSIKHSGVYQNLTVVDNHDDTYTIIIGHRRHAAAKIAGLSELPCVIADMSEHDQLETMLVENMQRSDLTVIEEAQGLQLMIDLGDSVTDIAKTTGFSKKKIKSRLFLNSYDVDTVEKAFKKGATLDDYVKLSRIKDETKREEVAKHLGTSNFAIRVKEVIDNEKWSATKPDVIKVLKKFGAVETSEYYYYYEYKKVSNLRTVKEARDFCENNSENRKIRYRITSYNNYAIAYLMLTEEEQKKSNGRNNMDDENKEFRLAIYDYRDSLIKEFNNYIDCFIKETFDSSCSKPLIAISEILELIIRMELEDNHNYTSRRISDAINTLDTSRSKFTKSVKDEHSDIDFEITDESKISKYANDPIRLLIALLRREIDLNRISDFLVYDRSYTYVRYYKLKHPNQFIDFLERYGFETPDELRQYIDGTHPMYTEEGCKQIFNDLKSANTEGESK